MAQEDPYAVLGLQRGADKAEIKAAFRQLAMRLHPDKDPSPQAAAEYFKVKKAADRLLSHGYNAAAHDAEAMRRAWKAQPEDIVAHWQRRSRSTGSTLAFCGMAVLGGVALFLGALHVHQGLYDYNKFRPHDNALPTPKTQQMMELISQSREEARLARSSGGSGGGDSSSSSGSR